MRTEQVRILLRHLSNNRQLHVRFQTPSLSFFFTCIRLPVLENCRVTHYMAEYILLIGALVLKSAIFVLNLLLHCVRHAHLAVGTHRR